MGIGIGSKFRAYFKSICQACLVSFSKAAEASGRVVAQQFSHDLVSIGTSLGGFDTRTINHRLLAAFTMSKSGL
jgi:hypothetical protein